jgi:hypothetical protein
MKLLVYPNLLGTKGYVVVVVVVVVVEALLANIEMRSISGGICLQLT